MRSSFTIDLQADPQFQFRIDAFSVPLESRGEFEATMRRNLGFIAKLPRFVNHMVFEKSSGPTSFDIVTIVGSRTYRSLDGKSVVLVSQFESMSAQEDVRQADAFKLHLKNLQSFVENSNPDLFEEVSTTGKFI